mgnify:FL=1
MALIKRIKLPNFLQKWLGYTKFRRFLWSFIFFVCVVGIFALHFLPERVPLQVGQVSPIDIQSNRFLTFEDEEATELKREEAARSVQDVYKLDRNVLIEINEKINDYFNKVLSVVTNTALTDGKKIEILQEDYGLYLNQKQAQEVLTFDARRAEALITQTKVIVETVYSQGVSSQTLQFAKEKIFSDIELLNIDPIYRLMIKSCLNSIELQPNLIFDLAATEEKRREAREAVEPVNVVIQKGERIVSKGEVLTQRQVDILTWLGYKNSASPLVVLLGLSLFTGLIMVLGVLFFRHYRKDLYRNETYLLLLMLIVFLTLFVAKVIISMNIGGLPEGTEQVGHMIPVAFGTMLITLLLDTKLAIFVTVIFSMFTGLLTGEIAFVLTSFIGGLVGVFSVSHLSQRSDLAKAGLWVALANVASVLTWGFLNNLSWSQMAVGSGYGVANGILSSILTIGLLPYLETGFGITTPVRLLELSNPNHPLLKKLLLQASGTYHHSILVGNLAEAAADSIGAESLLVRVGAYYHDIGKIKRPYFFVENQLSGENPHDKITAPLSTLIITSHVKDGVELAKNHGLPQVVVDMIAQHHGTGLIKYFYHKARETDDTIKEEDFRYDGPKPQTKEAAIIMLADTVEAAVRSLKEPTQGKIEGMVRTLIKDRLNDGQLEECDLTFKDLDKIANAFVRVLTGVYHHRIEYPDSVLKAMEKKKKGEKNVSGNNQPAGKGSPTPPVGS